MFTAVCNLGLCGCGTVKWCRSPGWSTRSIFRQDEWSGESSWLVLCLKRWGCHVVSFLHFVFHVFPCPSSPPFSFPFFITSFSLFLPSDPLILHPPILFLFPSFLLFLSLPFPQCAANREPRRQAAKTVATATCHGLGLCKLLFSRRWGM